MDFTETACACALLLRIRKDRRKKRHWVHPVVSKRLLNGQFYKLYEDLRNCRGKFFSYFRMSIESFDKLLVLVGPRITYENTRLRLSVPPQERLAVTLRWENTYFRILLYFRYTGLFISPSGTSELDCATTKTDTTERSIWISRGIFFFFLLGALAYLQVPPLGGSRDEKWRAQWIRKRSVSW